MSYRNIEVNGKPFQYSIGRSHVKIRGEGYSQLFAKSEIGQPIEYSTGHVVTPANIRNAILGRTGPRTFVCKEHGTSTTVVAIDPYDEEIYHKRTVVPACQKCLDASGWAI